MFCLERAFLLSSGDFSFYFLVTFGKIDLSNLTIHVTPKSALVDWQTLKIIFLPHYGLRNMFRFNFSWEGCYLYYKIVRQKIEDKGCYDLDDELKCQTS